MPREQRPDPEKLLARLQAEEARSENTRGQFRIYLGAAPGVGKTYAMLNEGQRRRGRKSADVVIGVVETYDRCLTMEIAEGLEVVPRRGDEMDVDAVLARHPSLVLVDELAHRNAPGSKHDYRWQDVLDLLEGGISVLSSMNIWHLESVRLQCQQITGMNLVETVPDWVVDQADDIELIDMAPEALRSRVRHGNVYPADRAVVELEGLFRPATLAALRELALRRTAQQVDGQLQRYMREHDLSGWRVDERVLVCIDHRPIGPTLLRRGRRMAQGLQCPLSVACIRLPDLCEADKRTLADNRQLAEEQCSEIIDIEGANPVESVARLAAESRATQLIIAHPHRPRWLERLLGSPARELLRRVPDIDVHVVAEPAKPGRGAE
jgi:two-component system sensor histidine kinase KdpD